MTKAMSQSQIDRRALMRARTLARLEHLAISARAEPYTFGRRAPRSDEVKRLQRRVRAVTQRWSPQWITVEAAKPGATVNLEHVVPVIVLVERILKGDEVPAVINQSATCRVTYDEHKHILPVAFRVVAADLYKRMLSCPLAELTDLGWERYEVSGMSKRSRLNP